MDVSSVRQQCSKQAMPEQQERLTALIELDDEWVRVDRVLFQNGLGALREWAESLQLALALAPAPVSP